MEPITLAFKIKAYDIISIRAEAEGCREQTSLDDWHEDEFL
jgi:hypothetical protein